MYNVIIYLYLLGVAVYSLFNDKVRKMWRGEREAFVVLREKVDPEAKYVYSMQHRSESLSKAGLLWSSCVAIILNTRSFSPSSLLPAMKCARTMRVRT